MSKKKNKKQFVDDGRTIYNMDVEGMPGRRTINKQGISLTKEEKRAFTKATIEKFLPMLLGVILCFGLAILIIYFWLK